MAMAGDPDPPIEKYLVKFVITIVLNDYVGQNESLDVVHEGVVLNDQWILTTRGNLRELETNRINLKTLRLFDDDRELKDLVEDIIKLNDTDNPHFDLALIKLNAEAKLMRGNAPLIIPATRPGPKEKATLYGFLESDDEKREVTVEKFGVDLKHNIIPENKVSMSVNHVKNGWKIHIRGGPLVSNSNGNFIGLYSNTDEYADAPDWMDELNFQDLSFHKAWIKKTMEG